MKAFGDMGQMARLRLIRDGFIAGHGICELRRHLDSMPPETPIRGVVDRCRVWESHADPATRQVSKPSPDPIYPAYVVNISETTRVVAVTRPRSGPDQLEDLLRRLLMAVATPVPIPEVPPVEKLLQRLVSETQSRPPPVVSPPLSVGLEQMLRSFLSGQQATRPPPRQRPIRRDWNGVVFFTSRVSGTVQPQYPGGGATPVAAPRRMMTNDVSDTAGLSGGGGGGGSVDPLLNVGGVGRISLYKDPPEFERLSTCLVLIDT